MPRTYPGCWQLIMQEGSQEFKRVPPSVAYAARAPYSCPIVLSSSYVPRTSLPSNFASYPCTRHLLHFFSLSLDCFLHGGRAFLEGGPWLASCCSSPSGAVSVDLGVLVLCNSDANFSQCLTLSQQWTSWQLFPFEALAYLA